MICACVCMYMHVDKLESHTLGKKRATEHNFGNESSIYHLHHLFIPQTLLYHIWALKKKGT